MKFHDALVKIQGNPSKENLNNQVSGLIQEMTLKEKTGLLAGRSFPRILARLGHGVLFHRHFLSNTWIGGGCARLGIPEFSFTDGGRGIVTGKSTCFPAPMLRAASFDADLEAEIGDVLGKEARVNGANLFGGVCINIVRNPRWGRSQEAYGEDPHLAGVMGAQLVEAVQKHGVMAVPKHFALNSIENLRFEIDVKVDQRSLREVYTPHFKKCIDAGALCVMSAYNRVNGKYCGENKELLTGLLREEWGFDGFVISDFMWGIHDTKESLEAGCDLEMPLRKYHHYPKVKRLIRDGQLSEDIINQAAANVLRSLLRQQAASQKWDRSISRSAAHLELAERAALMGMVLLKNNGVLPIARNQKISIVGPFADIANTGDHGSSSVRCENVITPYQGLAKIYPGASVCSSLSLSLCLEAARDAGVVVVCVGSDYLDEGEFLINTQGTGKKIPKTGSGGDRLSLNLKPEEVNLVKALKESGKQVVVILFTGSIILTGYFEEYADGIIAGFYGGERMGDALAKLVCGQENFSGKLPVTIAKRVEDYPEFKEPGEYPYEITYGYYHGYTLFDKTGKEPAYPFGFGLSYTSFKISHLSVEQSETALLVSVQVENTGRCDGAEVVQVYAGSNGATGATAKVVDVKETPARFERPVKRLKGFQRVALKTGERQNVMIEVPFEDLKFYDPVENRWTLDPAYTIFAGNSSRNATENQVVVNIGKGRSD